MPSMPFSQRCRRSAVLGCRLAACWLAMIAGSLRAADGLEVAPGAEGVAFFEAKIRPVLAEHCYSCHSGQAKKLKAGLYLDSLGGVMHGGESGPAVIPGNPEKSLLNQAVRYHDPDLAMPPKVKLSDRVIVDFEQWVKMGAPWPKQDAS